MVSVKTYFCKMERQIVRILNIEILEPGTFISNTIMATACFIFYFNLKKISSTNKFHKYLSFYFLYMAISAVSGAFAHSLYLYTGKLLHVVTWIITGIAIYYVEFGLSIHLKQKEKLQNFAKVQLIVFILLITFFQDFFITKINLTLGLLGVVFPISLFMFFKHQEKHFIYSALGISTAIVPALIHKINFTFAGIFNMNDLSHFVVILSQFLIFLGFRQGVSKETNVLYSKSS